MKRNITIFLIFLFVCYVAAFSQSITTQGVLRDGTGHSVADDTYTMTFRIYDVESGGTAIWETTQDIEVTNGIYNVTLGSTDDPLDMLESDGSYWLGVEIGSDGEMTPRMKLSVSPWEFARLSGDENVFPSAGNVGIGTTNPSAKLTLSNNIATSPIDDFSEYQLLLYNTYNAGTSYGLGIESGTMWFNSDNNYRFYRDGSNCDMIIKAGNVGIGTTSPNGKLSFGGTEDGNGSISYGIEFKGASDFSHAGIWSDGYSGYNGDLVFGTDGDSSENNNITEKMRIKGNGYVGIGTDTPNSALSVNGRAEIMGTDFLLGTDDGRDIGSKTQQRALVHDNNDELVINFNGDFEGGTKISGDVDISGDITFDGEKPIRIKRYTKSNVETYDWDTEYHYSNWSAAVVGWDAGYCDVDETGAEASWKVLMVKGTDDHWHLTVEGHTHINHPDWTVDVMFIQRELVKDYRY